MPGKEAVQNFPVCKIFKETKFSILEVIFTYSLSEYKGIFREEEGVREGVK